MKKKRKVKAKPVQKKKRVAVRKRPKRPAKKASKVKVSKARGPKKAPERASAPPPASRVIAPPNSVSLGRVEDYFAHVGVIALTLQSRLLAGQRIQVLGHTTHIEQTVDSMQINRQPVAQAESGDSVGLKVIARARAGDHVFLLL